MHTHCPHSVRLLSLRHNPLDSPALRVPIHNLALFPLGQESTWLYATGMSPDAPLAKPDTTMLDSTSSEAPESRVSTLQTHL